MTTAREKVLAYLAQRAADCEPGDEAASFERLHDVIEGMTDARFHNTTTIPVPQ